MNTVFFWSITALLVTLAATALLTVRAKPAPQPKPCPFADKCGGRCCNSRK